MEARKNQTANDKDGIAGMACGCVMMRARLISRVVTSIYDDEFRAFGINSPQFALLVVMSAMGPASRAEIGRFHHQERSTLTRNLKIMLSEGWIEEISEGTSGRARPVGLTDSGRKLLATVAPAWQNAQERTTALLGTKGTGAITEIADGILKVPPTG